MGTQGRLNFNKINPHLTRKANEIKNEIDNIIPSSVGKILVDGFKKSWDFQRFNDDGSTPWREVKRRTDGDPWFGFRYIPGGSAKYRAPSGGRPRTSSRKYYSPRATSRAILFGDGSSNLRDSIVLRSATRGRVVIASDQPHAAVHNEGGTARIFGRKVFQMPKRQFMGTSGKLNRQAYSFITKRIKKILS